MIALLLTSIVASAFPLLSNRPCLIQNANFRPSRTGLAELGLPLELLNAVPRIELLDDEGKILEQCSATSVSSNGHLLSAAHCLERCMDRAGLYSKVGDISRLDRSKLIETKCKIRVNGQATEAKLLAASDCKNEERTPGAACPRQDYVLMQIKSAAPTSCLPLAVSTPGPGEDVGSVGHPVSTVRAQWRSDAQDSNGKEQFVSEGKTISATMYCDKLVDRGSDERPGKRWFEPKSAEDVMKGVVEGDFVQTRGADQVGRSSGGPLVALSSGTVVGIAGFTLGRNNHSRYTECEGSTFYIAVAPIVKLIKRDFPSLDISVALSCNRSIDASK